MVTAGATTAGTATANARHETLDAILRRHATTTPDKPALIDFADRPAWTTGTAQSFTWQQLNARVDHFASFFAMLALKPDTVVALQMPPTSDAVVVFLALSRAGLIAAPMPLALREAELTERLALVGAKAIVTQAEVLGAPLGVQMRDVAAELFNIRFVFCAGDRVPDGLVELERVFVEAEGIGPAPEVERKGNPADYTASLAWTLARQNDKSAPVLVPRTHNHWIATGLMTGIEAGIDGNSILVTPFAPSGLKGIGVGMLPWLIAGATLVTGLPATIDQLVEEATTRAATHILVPTEMARRLTERLDLARAWATVIAVGDGRFEDGPLRGHLVIDATVIGEYGVVAQTRRERDPRLLPIGPVHAPSGVADAPVLLETRLVLPPRQPGEAAATTGDVLLRGAMVPAHPWQGGTRHRATERAAREDGFVATGVRARAGAGAMPVLEIVGPPEDHAGFGGLEIDLSELDGILKDVDGVLDAAAVALPGPGAPRIGAIVVPSPGATFDADGYLAALRDKRLGMHRLPEVVFTVPAIARAVSGRVMRSGMVARLAQTAQS